MTRKAWSRLTILASAVIVISFTPSRSEAWEFSYGKDDTNVSACIAETVVSENVVGFKAYPGAELWAYAEGYAAEGAYGWQVDGSDYAALNHARSSLGGSGSAIVAQGFAYGLLNNVMLGKTLKIGARTGGELEVPLVGAKDALEKFLICYTGVSSIAELNETLPSGHQTRLIAMPGTCTNYVVADKAQSCGDGLYRASYSTNLVSFAVLSEDTNVAVTFFGRTSKRRHDGKLLQSVEMISVREGTAERDAFAPALGSCTYEGFMGSGQTSKAGNFQCYALDPTGKTYSFTFEKSELAPIDVTQQP